MPSEGAAPHENQDTPVEKPKSPVEAALGKAKATQVMTDDEMPSVKLTGHPAEGEGEEPGPGEGEGEGEGEEAPRKATPKGEEAEGEGEGEGDEDEGKKKQPESKYKTKEEAEKAAKAAARKMTEATEEAARLREENKTLKQQNAENQEKIAERASELTEEAMEEFTEKVLGEMQELDASDPEYRKKMAKLWGKIHKEREKQFSKALKQAAKEAATEVLEEKSAEASERNERTRLWDKCNRAAAKAGLEMEDVGADEETGKPLRSDDYLLFWRTAPDAPDNLDEDGKIEWTIKEVKRITGRKVKAVKEKDEKVRKLQERQQPLGRGSAGPPLEDKATGKRPSSLNSALEKARASRRI